MNSLRSLAVQDPFARAGGAVTLSSGDRTSLPLFTVALAAIVDNRYQTRLVHNAGHVTKLAASLLGMAASLPDTKGLQQPPIARLIRAADGSEVPALEYQPHGRVIAKLDAGEWHAELAFGHSRHMAFRCLAAAAGDAPIFKAMTDDENGLLGLTWDAGHYSRMPLLLTPLTDAQLWTHAVTENHQRRDITAIEEAIALRRATDELGMTITDAGKVFGWSRPTASNKLRLLNLPPAAQGAVMSGKLSERQGRALLVSVDWPSWLQDDLLGRVMANDVSADSIDATVNRLLVEMPSVWQWYKNPAADPCTTAGGDSPILGPCATCSHVVRGMPSSKNYADGYTETRCAQDKGQGACHRAKYAAQDELYKRESADRKRRGKEIDIEISQCINDAIEKAGSGPAAIVVLEALRQSDTAWHASPEFARLLPLIERHETSGWAVKTAIAHALNRLQDQQAKTLEANTLGKGNLSVPGDGRRQYLLDLDRQLFTTAQGIDRFRDHEGEEGWGGRVADKLRSLINDLRMQIAQETGVQK